MRFLQLRNVDFVVLGYRSVAAVDYWLGLAREIRHAQRSLFPLDPGLRDIDTFAHAFSFQCEQYSRSRLTDMMYPAHEKLHIFDCRQVRCGKTRAFSVVFPVLVWR